MRGRWWQGGVSQLQCLASQSVLRPCCGPTRLRAQCHHRGSVHAHPVLTVSSCLCLRAAAAAAYPGHAPESVGTWTTNWQWVPCDWDHSKCAGLMKDMGFDNVYTPTFVEGHDSFSLRPMATLRRPFGPDPMANEAGKK